MLRDYPHERRPVGRTPSELVTTMSEAFADRDWERLRRLYHPEAQLQAVMAGEGFLSGTELVSAFQRAVDDSGYRPPSWSSARDIDEHAALITGVAGRRLEHRGLTEGSRAWVMTFRDGLLYRSRFFATANQALRCYREHGVDLGIAEGDAASQPDRAP